MNERTDYLNRPASGENPFKLPEAYFEGLEDRLLARIAEEEKQQEPVQRPVWRILKPALALAATFALIFGMGYGVLALTHTLDRGTGTTDTSAYALSEEELISPVSLINYYQTAGLAEEAGEIDEETLVDYLSTGLSWPELAEIYAQLY
jgi:hypothetical protein